MPQRNPLIDMQRRSWVLAVTPGLAGTPAAAAAATNAAEATAPDAALPH